MPPIDPSTSLGALVAEHPARARLFERLRFDFCCGGGQSLAEACTRRGLDPDTVATLLELIEEARLLAMPIVERDWREAGIAELCDHIVSVHHARVREELPRICEQLSTVVRVHGRDHQELHDLARLFAGIRDELEHHLDTEEQALFPVCRALESGDGATFDEQLIVRHEREHSGSGAALSAIRELTGDYDTERALCGAHRRLLEALHSFELDLHQHVHKENNILFPRVRELAAQASGAAAGELPLCCQAWAAEQSLSSRRSSGHSSAR